MAYASWSKGYKTGGWTTRLSNPLPTAPGFGEEKAETIEAGLKSEFLNRRLQMNLSVYKTKYNGIQLNFQEGISPTIRNAGDADIKGAELEVNAAITAGFSVSASAGYTHAEYTSVLSNAVVAPDQFHQGVYVGAELPKTPKTKFNISPRYEFPLAGKGSVVLIADATHTAKMRNDTEGSLLLNRRATNVYNAGITYKAEDDKWDVTLGGTNLSDERYLTTGQAQLAGGQIYGTYNRPREWYLTLQFRQ